jgi:exonuclease VII small subunit
MQTEKPKKGSLNENLKQLAQISSWFDDQKELDIEEGLKKVREAADLIKTSRKQLDSLENEFREIEKEFSDQDK